MILLLLEICRSFLHEYYATGIRRTKLYLYMLYRPDGSGYVILGNAAGSCFCFVRANSISPAFRRLYLI